MLNDKIIEPSNGEKAQRAVVILHGLGDSAEGIIGLGEAFAPHLPNTVFLAPDAPDPCEFSPFGFQWFSAADWTSAVVLKGIQKAAPVLNAYLDHVLDRYSLPASKLALVGFSQGSMMSLHVGPRRKEALAGILGYSGALVGGDLLQGERASNPPIMLVHGTHDDVVPFTSMHMAVSGLQNVNMNVESIPCPGLGHSINDQGLFEGVRFLKKCLD